MCVCVCVCVCAIIQIAPAVGEKDGCCGMLFGLNSVRTVFCCFWGGPGRAQAFGVLELACLDSFVVRTCESRLLLGGSSAPQHVHVSGLGGGVKKRTPRL